MIGCSIGFVYCYSRIFVGGSSSVLVFGVLLCVGGGGWVSPLICARAHSELPTSGSEIFKGGGGGRRREAPCGALRCPERLVKLAKRSSDIMKKTIV